MDLDGRQGWQGTWAMGHIFDIFLSNVKKLNTYTMEEVHKKIINWHNEVHTYWQQFWHHIWWSLKTLKMSIEIIFGQFCWPSYLTSKLTSISVNLIMSINFFFVNLLHSLHVWLFDIWHLFDNLTSFCDFDRSIKLKPPQPAQGYFCEIFPMKLQDSLTISNF